MPRKAGDYYRPTQREIRTKCAEIQASWSNVEKEKREKYLNSKPVEALLTTVIVEKYR